jgi:outer membrane protein TolC
MAMLMSIFVNERPLTADAECTWGNRMLDRVRSNWVLCLCGFLIAGCAQTEELKYLGDDGEVEYYIDHATSIDFPHVHTDSNIDAYSQPPRTIADLRKDEILDMTLEACRSLALMNSKIIRSRGAFLSAGNTILANPNNAPSIYDPAIQETGVLFGGRGIEAALSAFDATFQTTGTWGRNEQVRNSVFQTGIPSGAAAVAETANIEASLSKVFGYGGQLQLKHNVDYLGSNTPTSAVFAQSSYSGSLSAQYRHPLLAGSGTEFTQVAGPVSSQLGGLSGVTQGVVIARINHDITLTQFEAAITNLVKEVEDSYWDLYLAYRIYDTSVVAMKSAQQTWHVAKKKLQAGGLEGFDVEDEAQARDRFFDTRATSELNLSQLYKAESALRRLIGLSVNDGKIIRPSDEPIIAKLDPDWAVSIADALTHRLELRRHKWNIKSLELQLRAAQNLVRPRLDFVAGYRVNGFGDDLIDYDDGEQLNSFYSLLAQNNQTGWNAGFTFALPLGLRSAKAQMQNVELRLAKARDVLAAQELEISHEIGNAFQELAESYTIAKSYLNRRAAAKRQVEVVQSKYDQGTESVDLVVRAQASLADAEVAYFRSLVSYNQALVNLQYRQGTLLAHNSVSLSEGDWDAEAYDQALRKARARSNALDAAKYMTTEPTEFVEHNPDWEGTTTWPADLVEAIEPATPDVPTIDDADGKKKPESPPRLEIPQPQVIPKVPPVTRNEKPSQSTAQKRPSKSAAKSWQSSNQPAFFPHSAAHAKNAARPRRLVPSVQSRPSKSTIQQVVSEGTTTTVTEVILAD